MIRHAKWIFGFSVQFRPFFVTFSSLAFLFLSFFHSVPHFFSELISVTFISIFRQKGLLFVFIQGLISLMMDLTMTQDLTYFQTTTYQTGKTCSEPLSKFI
jgi:hypothetical protein